MPFEAFGLDRIGLHGHVVHQNLPFPYVVQPVFVYLLLLK